LDFRSLPSFTDFGEGYDVGVQIYVSPL